VTEIAPPATDSAASLQTLEQVQRRVLWLATSIIHHANKVRETRSGVKVGGHQASSASMVSIMTALYFEHLRGVDRVSVKPHASPVLHAINYLLGRLDERYLTELRSFGGLQSYPSRTKDPDPVDFSTGSVGIGATATLWSALAHRYVAGHFEVPQAGREIALIGDAELDEGAIWEALVDPMVPSLGEVLWIVDLNRQSLDRVVPDIAAGRIGKMFGAAGWQTITVKYGRLLRSIFEREGGEALRRRIDEMPNEEYQRLLRSDASELRERLPGSGPSARGRRELRRLVAELDDQTLAAAVRDLAGHDLSDLLDAFAQAGEASDRPTVIFAYTIKRATRPITQHCCRRHNGAAWPPSSAPTTPIRGRGSTQAHRRTSCVRVRPRGWNALRWSATPRRRCPPMSGASTPGRPPPSRSSAASSPISRTRPPRSQRTSCRSPRTSPPRRISAAGSTASGCGTSATGSTGSRMTPTRWCAGESRRMGSTSSWGSPRATSSACSPSWARRGHATAGRCCRSARSTTRSSTGRSNSGRSACTRAVSRS
jgi:transketolase N-terminal domain/subunit